MKWHKNNDVKCHQEISTGQPAEHAHAWTFMLLCKHTMGSEWVSCTSLNKTLPILFCFLKKKCSFSYTNHVVWMEMGIFLRVSSKLGLHWLVSDEHVSCIRPPGALSRLSESGMGESEMECTIMLMAMCSVIWRKPVWENETYVQRESEMR